MSITEQSPPPVAGADKVRQKAVMLDIQRRLISHLEAGRTTDFAPAPYQVAARVFTDPQRLEAERRELFLKLPMLAAFTCDMPNPGDVVVFEAAGPSILIARGRDGRVRAFLNRCSHRAAKLTHGCSKARLLTCPFHGWSYDLHGRLVGLPGEAAFEGLDRAGLDLTPVPVAEWCGLIFVKAH
ncbi:MAG TPA: Rieske (2Fe-2S) protein, partial [Phenylobacterium sp.]|nr:Rieske (2Fe-2S) protein [Phenylobacterium sp.]